MFITAPLTIAGTWNRPKCPSNGEWRIKMQYLYKIEWCKKPDWSTRVQHGLGLKCYVTMEAEIRAMALKAKACWVDQKLIGAGEESQNFQRNTAHHLDKNQSIQSVNSLKHGQLLSCVYVQCWFSLKIIYLSISIGEDKCVLLCMTMYRVNSFLLPCGFWGLNSGRRGLAADALAHWAVLLVPHTVLNRNPWGRGSDKKN